MGGITSYFTSAAEEEEAELPFDPSTVYVAPKVDIPLDESDGRYVKSFTVEQVQDYRAFFQEFGFVVIRDALSPEECVASIDEVWSFLETRGYKLQEWYGPTDHEKQANAERPPAPIQRDDPSTWDNDWPPMSHIGIVGYLPVFSKQALANRQNMKIYSVFSTLMQRKDLMVNHDRFGLFRPTRNADGSESSNDGKWRTSYSLHWDLNPWRYTVDDERSRKHVAELRDTMRALTYKDPNEFYQENSEIGTEQDEVVNLQGLINFADNQVEDGGFQTVVSFHRHLGKWAESTRDSQGIRNKNRCMVRIDCDDPLYTQAQRVSMRAGSIVIWDQRMAHGSAPNNSSNPRICQFIKMSPALDLGSRQAKHRAMVVQSKVDAADIELTDTGKCLFGLRPWN